MKKGKLVFVGLMLSFCALSVLGKNNFNLNGFGIFSFEDSKTVKSSKVVELINEELVVPMKKCYAEANPHIFMTKCYSDLRFEFNRDKWAELGIDEERSFPSNYPILGNIVFEDCGQIRHICSISVTYDTKVITVQESFFATAVDYKTYLTDFCAKAKKEAKDKK